MNQSLVRISKFLSRVLRHKPGSIGLELDAEGWAKVADLLQRAREAGRPISASELEEVVRTNDKRRFAFSADGTMIRASQGHSVAVDLGLEALVPPRVLYHGTVDRCLASIRVQGLVPGRRQSVHLSADQETAAKVGARRGKPVILEVDAERMQAASFEFFMSANGVWLTDAVPARFLRFPDESPSA